MVLDAITLAQVQSEVETHQFLLTGGSGWPNTPAVYHLGELHTVTSYNTV